jgi:hypothetical protein
LTLPQKDPTFRVAFGRGSHVALVTVSVTARATVIYTDARCPTCNRRVMSVPGTMTLDVRVVANDAARSGRGRVVGCKRCATLCEIIEHARTL